MEKLKPQKTTIALNKKALSDYEIIRDFECAIKLLGHEVKSIRDKHLNIKASFVIIRD